MSRPLRLEYPGAVYHVVARGNERRAVFRDDRDRELYLARLQHYRDRFGFRVYAYCLMTNHIHLALETGKVPLSRIMLALQGSYTQAFNRRHRRVGHLFQGRYKALVVQKDRYLLALVRYIHENPVRAGIVGRPSEYRWSSDQWYAKGRGPAWLDVDSVLGALARGRQAALRAYRALMARGDGVEYEDLRSIGQVVKGDEEFATRVFEEWAEPELLRRGLTLERVVRAVTKVLGVDLEDLRGPRRLRGLSTARAIAGYVGREQARIPLSRMAEHFRRDGSTLVRDVRRLEERLRWDARSRDAVAAVLKYLALPQ
ncbi:MAG: REP-associated tyrosine transposase [Acidobacteriota bacterium]